MSLDSDSSLLQPFAFNEIQVNSETFMRLNNSHFLDSNGDRIIIISDSVDNNRQIVCVVKSSYMESPDGSISASDDSDI
jgi:hypothetical protein